MGRIDSKPHQSSMYNIKLWTESEGAGPEILAVLIQNNRYVVFVARANDAIDIQSYWSCSAENVGAVSQGSRLRIQNDQIAYPPGLVALDASDNIKELITRNKSVDSWTCSVSVRIRTDKEYINISDSTEFLFRRVGTDEPIDGPRYGPAVDVAPQ